MHDSLVLQHSLSANAGQPESSTPTHIEAECNIKVRHVHVQMGPC